MTSVAVRVLPDMPAPTRLDKMIESVAPVWAAKRFQARMGLQMAGQYIGARKDRRATEEWQPGARSGNSDTLGDLSGRGGLRARSRDLERNEPLAKGAVNSNLTAVLGAGLVPWPQIDRSLLGLDDPTADAWELQALRLYRAHLSTTAVDYSGHSNLDEMSEQVFWGEFVNGDILAIRRYVERPNRLFGLAIQLVEADRVCNPNGRYAPNILDGVEFNVDTGEANAYHVASAFPGDRMQMGYSVPTWTRVPQYDASGSLQATLVMRRLRPDLLRGVPSLAAVIEPLKKLGTYSNSELTAAVLSSFFTVFVKKKAYGDGSGPDLPTPFGHVAKADDSTHAIPSNRSDVRLGEGAIVDLAEGEDISTANPGRPNAQFDPFWLSMVRQIAIALEMPYEVLIKHFSASYSASRAALLEAWRVFLTRRARLVRLWYTPVWNWFIEEAVAKGYLNAPGFFTDPLIRAAYCGVSWSGPTMPAVDEGKQVDAARGRLELTITTLEEETANLTGTSWSRKFGQVTKERRMLADAGIPAPQDTISTRETINAPPLKPDDTEEGDE